jgi:glycine hydroxymethyltransferase
MVPFDERSPFVTSGMRIGTPAITTRGMIPEEMGNIVEMIDHVLMNKEDEAVILSVKKKVHSLMSDRPLFAW